MRRLFLLLGIAGLMAAPPSVHSADHAADEEGIRAVTRAIDKALGLSDIDAYVAELADDVIFMPPHESTLLGRDAIRVWMGANFKAMTLELKHIPDGITIENGIAYAQGRAEGTVTRKSGVGHAIFDSKYVWVLRKDTRGRWQIIHAIWNANTPSA